uniref:Uncharacterized protein n=1 Tax=Hyaloperonospora arabidopsidis (strain Emoy2) TaxID=559515 RepID=M4BYZ7_HYAAE
MKFFAEILQLVVPSLLTRYLPVLLFNQHLEDAVLAGLVPVVTAIVGWSLLSSFAILRCSDQSLLKQLISGIGGLALGSAGFHVTIVLFGAPVVECVPIQLGTNFLVADARLIPILQQSMATDTLARCAAFELHDHALGAAVFDVCSSKMAPLAARPQGDQHARALSRMFIHRSCSRRLLGCIPHPARLGSTLAGETIFRSFLLVVRLF